MIYFVLEDLCTNTTISIEYAINAILPNADYFMLRKTKYTGDVPEGDYMKCTVN